MAPRLPRERKLPKSDALKTRKTKVFGKRFPMVKKKAFELSVLCDIFVGIVCCDIDNNLHVYPEDKLDSLRQLLVKFVGLSDEKREKHASYLKDFLPALNSKKKYTESPIDVEDMSSEEFWTMVSDMDSKYDRFKAQLERLKNAEEEANLLKETPEGFSDEFIRSEKNGVVDTVTDQLGFGGLCVPNFDDSFWASAEDEDPNFESVSDFGDSFWVSAEDPNFGVVDTLGGSDIDTSNFGVPSDDQFQFQFLSDNSCMTNNADQLLNPNPTPIISNFGVSGNDQFPSDDSCMTNNPYQLLNPNLTPIMSNFGVSGSNQFLSDDSYLTNNPYQLSNPNLISTPISCNLGILGQDQVMAADYRMWDPNPTAISYNLGVSGYDQGKVADYQIWDPNPTPITYNLGVWRHDQLMGTDSFPIMEPYQAADLNPTPITSSLEEVSRQHPLMGVDTFAMNKCEMFTQCLGEFRV